METGRNGTLIGLAILAYLLVACGDGGLEIGGGAANGAAGQQAAPVAMPAAAPSKLLGLDISIHGVPLEEIYFDTFDGGMVPLSQATPELVERLRDAIPPIEHPRYEPSSEATWLDDNDLVLGYVEGGKGYAYPFKILNYHEIVNEILSGQPVLISYCPLCRSAIVYHRELDGQSLSFGNTSALYESDMVMYDRETGSYWHQVSGSAIVGELTGRSLRPLPSITTTWREWHDLHPSGLVLTRDTGFQRPYEQNPFSSYAESIDSHDFAFPVSERGRDKRLRPAAEVLAVSVGGAQRAYSLEVLGDNAVNDVVGGRRLVIFSSAGGPSGAAFSAEVDGRDLSFALEDGEIRDLETGSRWNFAGEAVTGPLMGSQLSQLPTRYSFWFALVASFPNISLYNPVVDAQQN